VKERRKTALDVKGEGRAEKVLQGRENTVRIDLLKDKHAKLHGFRAAVGVSGGLYRDAADRAKCVLASETERTEDLT
jgi:hypothetical protein